MNLPPAWVTVIEEAGHTAVHWSTIGSSNAPDRETLAWAKAKGYVLFTHDLDFGEPWLPLTPKRRVLSKSGRKTTPPSCQGLASQRYQKLYPRSSSRCIDFGRRREIEGSFTASKVDPQGRLGYQRRGERDWVRLNFLIFRINWLLPDYPCSNQDSFCWPSSPRRRDQGQVSQFGCWAERSEEFRFCKKFINWRDT